MHNACNLNVLTLIPFCAIPFVIQNYRKLDKYLILTKKRGRWNEVFKG